MKTSLQLTLLWLILFIFIGSQSIAQTISIQSTVKDQNGKAIEDGEVSITFKLYTTASGGTDVWNETDLVLVEGGVYSHQLGSVTPLSSSIFSQQLYLGITIGNAQELIPRTLLSYSPYSLTTTSIANNGQSAVFESTGQLRISQNAIAVGKLGVNVPINTAITSSVDLAVGDNNTGLNQSAEDRLELVTNGTPRVVLFSDGKVGVGTLFNAISSNVKLAVGDSDCGIGESGGIIRIVSNNEIPISAINNKVMVSPSVGQSVNATTLPDLAVGDDDTGINQNGDGILELVTNNAARMTIIGNGRVGIGTSTPVATLDVFPTGNVGDPTGGSGIFFNDATTSLQSSSNLSFLNNVAISANGEIVASDHVVCFATINWSDERMKNILKKSDAKKDLAILKNIQITDYKYIDTLQKSNKVYKKLIAQQVESVYPEAVTYNHQVIPNVYQKAAAIEKSNGLIHISTQKKHTFNQGDLIDLITPNQKLSRIEVVNVIDEHSFSVKSDVAFDEVFVYGKWVNDFRGVDYEAIAMLNVSATQELLRKIENLEKTVDDLHVKNKTLKVENDQLRNDSLGINHRLSKIEAAMSEYLNKKEISTSEK